MIISKAHNFGFVHVPKCAGSTIRWPLKDKDDLGGQFFGTKQIDGLGRVNMNHVPMPWLRAHFPQAYDALQEVESYAIVRDPMDRFVSAIAQRARDLEQDPGAMRPRQIRELAAKVINYLTTLEGYPGPKQIFFAPQREFVFDGDHQAVTHIWPVETMPALLARLQSRHEITLKRDQTWNPTVTYNHPWMARPLIRIKDTTKRFLPTAQYAALRDFAVRAFTTKGAPVLEDTLRSDDQVTGFVAERYAVDFALHRDVLARQGTAQVAE